MCTWFKWPAVLIVATALLFSPHLTAPAAAQSTEEMPDLSTTQMAGFPLAEGAYWIYQGNVTWTLDGQVLEKDVTWKVEVKEVVQREQVTGYLLNGFPTDLAMYEEGDQPADHVLIQVGATRYYEAAVDALERMKDENDQLVDLVNEAGLILELPLQVDDVFGEAMQITRPDHMYAWWVNDRQPADLSVVQGMAPENQLFQYTLDFMTLSDHQTIVFVPGLGILGYTYVHHGTEARADVKLVKYHAGSTKDTPGQVVSIDSSANGGSVELIVGQMLEVTLEGNPSTGYVWEEQSAGTGVVEQQGEAEFISSSELIGAGGQVILRFLAVSPGEGQLQLVYHRPWETDTPPTETFSVQVKVVEGDSAAPAQEPAARQIVTTDRAPAAVGPYSQAVKVGNLVYTAGQVGLDPSTSQLVEGGIEEQTRQALGNLEAILEAAGTSLDNTVKTTVFLADINDYKAMNGVYAGFFPEAPPARSAVQVAALPLGALVEIEVVAVIP